MHRTFKKAIERSGKYQIWTVMLILHLWFYQCSKNDYSGALQITKVLVHHPDLSLRMQEFIFPASTTESVPMIALSKSKTLPEEKSASNNGSTHGYKDQSPYLILEYIWKTSTSEIPESLAEVALLHYSLNSFSLQYCFVQSFVLFPRVLPNKSPAWPCSFQQQI